MYYKKTHIVREMQKRIKSIPHSIQILPSRISDKSRTIFHPEEEMALNRRNISLSNFSTGIANNIIGGNFFTGLLLLMKADDAFIGLITMAIFLGNILQVLSPILLERFPSRKKLLIAARAIIYLFNIVVITAIPFLNFTNAIKLTLILAMVLLINLINAITAPGFSVWHIKSIPENIRASYFSVFSIGNGVFIYTMILIGSRIVDHFKDLNNEMMGLIIIRAVALVFAIIDLFFLFKIKEYPNTSTAESAKLSSVLLSPFKQKRYLITVAISCLWAFTANIPGPFYSVYLLKDLKMDYSYINLVNMINIPILILVTPIWSRRIQKTSWFKTLCFCMSFLIVHYVGLAFVTETTLFLYPISIFVAFFMLAGINLTFTNIPFINIPPENQTNYIGFLAAMNNLSALLGVTVGREFITRTENIKLNIMGVSLQNKQYILLLTALVMVITTFTIHILQKKVERVPVK